MSICHPPPRILDLPAPVVGHSLPLHAINHALIENAIENSRLIGHNSYYAIPVLRQSNAKRDEMRGDLGLACVQWRALREGWPVSLCLVMRGRMCGQWEISH